MSALVVLVANPVRPDRRQEVRVPAGTRLGDALPEGWDAAALRRNGDPATAGDRLRAGDIALAVCRPQGFEGVFATLAINILVSAAISFVFTLLFPPPRDPQRRDDETSPTYSFGGVSNNRTEGQPIPISYGRMKAGGTVINEFVDTQGIPPRTTLYQLISFGEGPFDAIGGVSEDTPAVAPLVESAIPAEIAINGNPAQNFAGVRAWVRLGTNEQEPIPGFDEVRQTFPVGSDLISPEAPGNSTTVTLPGFSLASDDEFTAVNDAFWTARAVSFDLDGEDVDGFVVRLRFPLGFYAQNSTTGATELVGLTYQVRYRELDGSSNPITTGGYASDGWVRLPVEGPVAFGQRSPFEWQVRGQFTDPQTYTPATPGSALSSERTTPGRINHPPAAGMGYVAGSTVPGYTSLGWINIDTLPPAPAVGDRVWLWGDLSDATDRGSGIYLEYRNFSGGGVSLDRWVLGCAFGRGSRQIFAYAGTNVGFGSATAPATFSDGNMSALAGANRWVHVAFEYAQNAHLHLFVNGAQIPAIVSESGGNLDLEWEGGNFHVADNPDVSDQTTHQFDGLMDEVKVYRAAIGSPRVRGDWNSGVGTTEAAPGYVDSMILRLDFEATGGGVNQSPVDWYGDGTIVGSGVTTGSSTGVVRSGTSGTPKRSKYRVEILRVSHSSSAANVADDVEVESIQSIKSLGLAYPNSPILGLHIPASEQLNDSLPTTTSINRCRLVPIWDGASTTVPAMRPAWSSNPAWICVDALTNRRYGLGRFYSVRDLDLPSFKAWADYCDEVVYDGRAEHALDHSVDGDDVVFDNSTTDAATLEVRGSLTLTLDLAAHGSLPATWQVGRFVRLSGFPDDSEPGVATDINSPAGEGYEIRSVTLVAGAWEVVAYWDRLDETDPWTSGEALGADVLATPADLDGAIVRGGQRRFECHATFDVPGRAWDAILDICAVGRAVPVREGSRIRIRHTAPKEPVGVLTSSNIVADSFRCDISSPRSRPNALTLNILDAEQGYEPVPVPVQDESIESTADQSFVRQENRQLFGVTDAAQAERHGLFILAVNRLLNRRGSFTAALDALPYEVGDLLRVSSDVLPRGDGGRALASSVANPADMLADREHFGGAAWTASGVTVTGNTATDPLDDAVADTIEDTSGAANGSVSQALSVAAKLDGWYSVSLFLKDGTNGAPVLELSTSRGASRVAFDLAGITATATDSIDLPARGGIQDVGGGWRYVWGSWYVKAADGLLETTVLDLALYPAWSADGSALGSVVASKITPTRDQWPAFFAPARAVVIDGDVTISGAETNTLHLQDFRGSLTSAVVDTDLTPPGTYEAGSTLFLETSLAAPALRGNPYIVSTPSRELLIDITGMRRVHDLSVDFDWVEYRGAVFGEESTAIGNFGGSSPASTGGGTSVPSRPQRVPEPIEQITAYDVLVEPEPGSFAVELTVGWQHPSATRDAVTGAAVYLRPGIGGQIRGGWRRVSTVDGLAGGATVALPAARSGDVIEIAVAPLSRAAPSPDPDAASAIGYAIVGLGPSPVALASLSAESVGLRALYSWEHGVADALASVLGVELRRGGWILGQPLALERGPTPDLWLPTGDASVGLVHGRTRNRAGAFSSQTTLSFSPSPPLEAEPPDLAGGASVEWETAQAGSWVTDPPLAGGPALHGSLVVNAAGELELTGAGLDGHWRSKHDSAQTLTVGQSRAPRPLLVTAAVEAEQVHPLTVGAAQWALGDVRMSRWSLEGPTHASALDTANCKLRIQLRIHDGSGWGAWSDFTAGVYSAVDVQFRLLASRPDASYNVRIKRFHTRVERPQRNAVEKTHGDLNALAEII